MRAAKLLPKVTSTHVFFFGYEGPEPESCFQQWFHSPFTESSTTTRSPLCFPTAEHYMMYHKALLMGDLGTAAKILSAPTPAEAKALGREVVGFEQDVWDRECDKVVERGNWLKFSQNEDCKEALLETGGKAIVEASPNDRVWGIGFAADEAERKEGEWGANKLGKALQRVRDRLRREG